MKQFKTKENKIHKINCIFLSRRKRIMYNHKRAQNIYMYYIYMCTSQLCKYYIICPFVLYKCIIQWNILYTKRKYTDIHTYIRIFSFHVSVYKIYKYFVNLFLFTIRYIDHFHQFHVISI